MVEAKDSLLDAWPVLNPGGTVLTCYDPPAVSLTASPVTPPDLPNGADADISWSVSNPNGVTCDATNGSAPWPGTDRGTLGTVNSGPLSGDTTFTIICTNPDGVSATRNVLVQVAPPPDPVITAEQFCTAFGGTITWSYGGSIEDYRIQVANDSGFSDILLDTGWVNAPGSLSGTVQDPLIGPGGSYWTRVKVRDVWLVESGWSAGRSFTHPPRVNFTLDPATPVEGLSFDAVDQSNYGFAAPAIQIWDFGDGSPLQSGSPATHTFTTAGAHTITLTVTDTNAQTCSDSVTFDVNRPSPGFKEVLPQ
jgi:PKD repeat protein